MLYRSLLLVLLTSISACGPAGGSSDEPAPASSFTQHVFESETLPARDYWLFKPSRTSGEKTLVIYLHGCNQNAPDAAIGTRWNELAEQQGIYVAYPNQKDPNEQELSGEQLQDHLFDGNGARCWNWFRPQHIQRDQGEAGTIAAITVQLINELDIDPNRVFIMGISAGAIMASTVSTLYPDLYAAAGLVAGCAYPACTDATGSLSYQGMGEHAQRLPVIIFQGTADEIQPYALGREALHQSLGMNDWADDGSLNGSVPYNASQTQDYGLDSSVFAGAGTVGDTCVRNSNSPCLGGALGIEQSYPFTLETFVDGNNCPLIQFWTIHGLTHNYPGGNTEGSFTDPLGPDITAAAYNFFMAQARDGSYYQSPQICSL